MLFYLESIHLHDPRTILVLRDNVIDSVSTDDGTIVARYQATNILDLAYIPIPATTATPGHGTKTLSVVTNALKTKEDTSVIEGNCTSMHYCNLTKQIVIGFSSGGVGLLSISGPRLNVTESRVGFSATSKVMDSGTKALYGHGHAMKGSNDYPYIRTTDVHSGRITCLTTYRTHGTGMNSMVVLAVADTLGVLSTWSLAPSATYYGYAPILSIYSQLLVVVGCCCCWCCCCR